MHPSLRPIRVLGLAALGIAGLLPHDQARAAGPQPPYALERIVTGPVIFGGGQVLGSSPSFTPDGATVYTHLYSDTLRRHTILVSHFRDGRWTRSETAPFSGAHDDLEPSVSADGRRLIFGSSRPVDGRQSGMQLWVVNRSGDGWGEPQPIGAPFLVMLESAGAPAQSANGTLFFGKITAASARNRGWPWELYLAERDGERYREPVRLNEAVNPGGRSWSHTVTPDGRYLILAAVVNADTPRTDSAGDIDLYVSVRKAGQWTPARNLGPQVNTVAAEVWPRVSPDGRYLFFNRQGPEGGRIFQVDLDSLLPASGQTPTAERGRPAGIPAVDPTAMVAQPFVPGIISAPDRGGITFTPDGRTAFFGGKTPHGSWGIMTSQWRDGQWSKPEVASFSGSPATDGDPQMAPDGQRLFFFSMRSAEGKPQEGWWPDLWYVERQGDSWGAARLVGAGPDGAWNPLTLRAGTPSPAADGTLYFFRCRDPQGKHVRIVRSRPVDGAYRGFEDLGDVVNGRNDGGFDVAVAPDQSFIVFTCSKRTDTIGRNDLYISYRDGEQWSEPHNLGRKVNTEGDEYSPTLSPDGAILFFGRGGIRYIPLAACEGVRAQTRRTGP